MMTLDELRLALIKIFTDAKLDKEVHGRLPPYHPKRKIIGEQHGDNNAKVH
jgi:hypothetical protein